MWMDISSSCSSWTNLYKIEVARLQTIATHLIQKISCFALAGIKKSPSNRVSKKAFYNQ